MRQNDMSFGGAICTARDVDDTTSNDKAVVSLSAVPSPPPSPPAAAAETGSTGIMRSPSSARFSPRAADEG